MDGGEGGADLVINKRFVSEAELEERRKRRQEEWEKVRKPEDPEGIWLSEEFAGIPLLFDDGFVWVCMAPLDGVKNLPRYIGPCSKELSI